MDITIFGLGYVGCVGLGCLAEQGHKLIGVDTDKAKVDLINNGKATIVEKDIDELIKQNYKNKRINATTNSYEAVIKSEVAIICVGTPNDENGHLDMKYIYRVAKEIGEALIEKDEFYTVAIRSTVMPGTNKRVAETIQKYSKKINGKDFSVVSNPEFLREGSAVADFFNPPYTILSSESEKGLEKMKMVYQSLNSEVIIAPIGSAELIKFVNNSFHGLKVVFANEVGRICKALGVDSINLMDLFTKDKILNISPYYFKPGFAYGGSCLPKDLKALNSIAHDKYVKLPVLSSIENSNQVHIDYVLNLIFSKNKKKIGFYGISFKAGTDDLRLSPALETVERLLGKGYEVKIYDKNVNLSRLTGKNKEYIFNKLPHINNLLMEDLDDFINASELLIIVNKDNDINKLLKSDLSNVQIIDLVRIKKDDTVLTNYEGICW
jgi:GDP-mannose 6-dehydrogenase